MSHKDPLEVFQPGFSGDEADKEARELIDAWRDEWHLEPEPEMDGGNSRVYESLIEHVATARNAAATRMRDRCVAKVEQYFKYSPATCEALINELQALTLEGEQEK